MDLKRLAKFKRIIIQCHDVPDADAVGAGFALQCYFRSFGADVSLVYGGAAEIRKPSLLLMLNALGIEIDHVSELPPDTDLLITIDCQRGAGNVRHFELPDTADTVVIDHHKPEIPEHSGTLMRPNLASCSTLVWDMLEKENYRMEGRVLNALYYGLFTDTNGLSELRHPLDRDLADVPNDTGLMRKLKNAAITGDELELMSDALQNRETIGGISIFGVKPCDANLLGFISDIAQQVVDVDCCVVYSMQTHGVKLSLRSSVSEIMASEIAAFICRGAGSGGGTAEKAGGFISFKGVEQEAGAQTAEEFIKTRIQEYSGYYDLIYAGHNDIDFGAMELYRKLPLPVAFAKSAEIFPRGTKMTVRTLEGDVDTEAADDIYLMIGLLDEVYPIKKGRFEAGYEVLGGEYSPKTEYVPIVLNRVTGDRCDVFAYAKTCVPKGDKIVRATELKKATKVFTEWDRDKYFSGEKGDWLVANEGSYEDCYIVRGDIFEDSYERVI